MQTLIYLICLLFISANNPADQCVGLWLTKEGKGKVQLYKCGNNYCGKLIWARDGLDKQGKSKLDTKNSNAKLRSFPIIGMVFLKDFSYDSEEKEWTGGSLYDPESGDTYKGYFWMEDNKTLKMRGYIGFSAIGRTETWTRIQ